MKSLTDLANFDCADLVFSSVNKNVSSNGKSPWSNIHISRTFPDGSQGPLIIYLPQNRKTFGIFTKEFGSERTASPDMWRILISLQSGSEPTVEEQGFIDGFERLLDAIKKHLISVRGEIGRHDLDMADLKKIAQSSYKWSIDDATGMKDTSRGPVMKPRLMYNKRSKTFKTTIVDGNTWKRIKPENLVNSRGNLISTVLEIPYIYIGMNMSLQTRLRDAVFVGESNTTCNLAMSLIPNAPKAIVEDDDDGSASGGHSTD